MASATKVEDHMDMRRTTLALPADLLAAIDEMVRAGKAQSRGEFVTRALRRELRAMEDAAIDAEFAAMADDAEYQAEARRIADEFAVADWEAFRIAEGTR